jgi:hypothetical protein
VALGIDAACEADTVAIQVGIATSRVPSLLIIALRLNLARAIARRESVQVVVKYRNQFSWVAAIGSH